MKPRCGTTTVGPGLGTEFLAAVDGAIERIGLMARGAPVFPGWDGSPQVRRMAVTVFPYKVLYDVTDTTLVILAYAHDSRRPGYWRGRFRP